MKKIILIFIATILYACSATEDIYEDITSPDYVNSSKAKRLEVPPDLTELEQSENYSVPGEAKSYKDYMKNEQGTLSSNENINRKLIANPEGMRIVKSGTLRWLVVEKEPDLIWPHVRDFWEELGFRVTVANKRTGIIETEWMDTEDLKLDATDDGVLSGFDKWLDSLSGFSDKRKFRTRVEIGEATGSTEIYISQRSAAAAADQHSRIMRTRGSEYNPSTIYKIDEYKSDDEEKPETVAISEEREEDDFEIDSELLTRLMIKLGATDYEAKEKVENPQLLVKAELIDKENESAIKLLDPFDRSWRRLGLALDIIGFVTEDKNRSEGIYYVRYNEIELPTDENKKDEDEGIIDRLIFWDDDEKKEKKQNQDKKEIKEESIQEGDEKYTGIEAPEVRPLDENYNPDDFGEEKVKPGEEETWLTRLWPDWGGEEEAESLPLNEQRYRVRIKPIDNGNSIVFLDYPNGQKNNSPKGRQVIKILYGHLK